MSRFTCKRILRALIIGALTVSGLVAASRLFWGPVYVPSESMAPTLQTGDVVLINRLAYGTGVAWYRSTVVAWSSPRVGDIVVFLAPKTVAAPPGTYLIKRVIARAGDTVEVRQNRVRVNGVEAHYTAAATPHVEFEQAGTSGVRTVLRGETQTPDFGPLTIPAGDVFVMGDNRDHSADSRVWGPLSIDLIEGRATRWKLNLLG